jgi:site-specific DNA recombinase
MKKQDIQNKKAIIYCRVSSKEQEQGFSLDSQQHLIEAYALERDIEIVEIIRVSESASKGFLRKMFFRTFDFCKENDVHVVLVEKIDRFTRNLKDAGFADDWIKEDPLNEIHFVKENFIASQKSKAHENFVWNMKVSIARFYTQNLSEEVIKGNVEKVSQGLYHGSHKLGYNCIGPQGRKIFTIDQEKLSIMKKFFENYASGTFSMKKLQDWAWDNNLRSRFGKRLYKSQIEKLLRDPFYSGQFYYKDELCKGNHEAIISNDVFDRITEIRTKGKATALIKHEYLFEKMITCNECEASFSSEKQKGNVYCYCKNHKPGCSQSGGLRQDKIESDLINVFDVFTNISNEDAESIREQIKSHHKTEKDYKETLLNGLNREYMTIQTRIERIYDDKISGIITLDFWQKKYNELIKEQDHIQNQITKIKSQESEYFELYINILDLAFRAKEIFNNENRTTTEKRQLLVLLFDAISISDKKVIYSLKEPVRKYEKIIASEVSSFELVKPLQNMSESHFLDKNDVMLPR